MNLLGSVSSHYTRRRPDQDILLVHPCSLGDPDKYIHIYQFWKVLYFVFKLDEKIYNLK